MYNSQGKISGNILKISQNTDVVAQMAGVFNCPMICGRICCSMEPNAMLTALSRLAW